MNASERRDRFDTWSKPKRSVEVGVAKPHIFFRGGLWRVFQRFPNGEMRFGTALRKEIGSAWLNFQKWEKEIRNA